MSSALVQKKPSQNQRTRTRRLWLWVVLLCLLAAFIALLNSPLGVRFALRFVQIPGFTLSTGEVSGTIWQPELRGVDIQGPGVSGRANKLTLNYDVAALTRQELRFSLSLTDADLELDPSKFASAPPSTEPTTAGGTPWKILPQNLELKRVRVKLEGNPFTLPDGTISLNSLEGKDGIGKANLGLRTADGEVQATVNYALEPFSFSTNFVGDATLGNAWWPGIRSGELKGQYRFKNDTLEGEVQVSGGKIVIPDLEQVQISDLSGSLTHRGSVIGYTAQGKGFKGLLKATGTVDYQKQRWTAVGTASPRLEPLLESFGLKGGTGTLTGQVTASGWTSARVQVKAAGDAAFQGVPTPRITADYTFIKGKSTLALEGDLRALGESQSAVVKLSSTGKVWNGTGELKGQLFQAPVSVWATLEGQTLSAAGKVLSSDVNALYSLKTGWLEGDWDGLIPLLKNSILRASFSGPLERLNVQVSKLEADLPGLGRKSYRGTGYAGTKGFGLDVGAARIALDPELRGTWQVRRFDLPQDILASGTGQIDVLASTLEGNVTLEGLPIGIIPQSGPLSLNWKNTKATWNPQNAILSWNGDSLEATLKNLSVQAGQELTLSGPVRLDLNTQNLTGTLEAKTEGGRATLKAEGRNATLEGVFRGFVLKGRGNLDTLTATLEGRNKNLRISAQYDKNLEFTALSGTDLNSKAAGTLDIAKGLEGLKAQGQFDLSALESFGLRGLSGVVNADARGQDITARAKYQGFDISARGNLQNLTSTLEASRKNLKIVALYNKNLEFTALSGLNLESRATGTLDIAKGLEGLKAQGQFDLSALESFGVKGLEGVINARADGKMVNATAKYQGFDITAKGNLQALTATLEGRNKNLKISAQYDKSLEFTALSGPSLSSKVSGTLDLSKGLEGLKAQGQLDLAALEFLGFKGLVGVVNADARGQIISARAKYQGFDITAKGNLQELTATLEGRKQNLRINAQYDKTLEFTTLSGLGLTSKIVGTLNPTEGLEGLKAQGQFDLSALESFGLKDLSGVVNANADGETITARAKYEGFNIAARGNLQTLTATLEASRKNLKIVALYNKNLEFTTLSGLNLKSKATGTLELSKGLEGLKAQGQFDLSALESFGVKGLEGVINARADGKMVNATAKYQGFDITAKGNLQALTATLEGRKPNLQINASYNKTFEFNALSGLNLESKASGTLDLAKGLEGLKAQGQFDLSALESFGLKGISGVINADARGETMTARAKYQGFDIVAKGNLQELTATLEAKRKNFKINAVYNKTLEFTALSGPNLNSKASGTLDLSRGFEGLKANGSLDLAALESFGFEGLEGIVNADARGKNITARATYQGFNLFARGNLQTQTAQLEAQGKGLSFAGFYDQTLSGTLFSGVNQKIDVQWSPEKGFALEGEVALEALKNFDIDAKGTLALEVTGKSIQTAIGTGQISGEVYGARANGNLTLTKGAVTAQLEGQYQGANGKLSGQVYPRVQGAGALEYDGERVQAQLSGEYSALRFSLKGLNTPRSVSGLKIPAQTLALEGQLTPALSAKGNWGKLALEYGGQKATFAGQIPLEYSGQKLQVTARGDWKPDFSGSLEAGVRGSLDGEQVTLELKGPWSALELSGKWPRYTTQLSGRLALPELTYSANATATVEGYPVRLDARGKGTEYALEGQIQGDEGGTVRLSGRDLNTWNAVAQNFQTRGVKLNGQLENGSTGLNGALEGRVSDFSFNINVVQNRLNARGEYSGIKGMLEAVLDPNKLEARAIKIQANAPLYGSLNAQGQYVDGKAALELTGTATDYGAFSGTAGFDGKNATLEGTLKTLAQAFTVAGQQLNVAPQTARVQAGWNGKNTSLSLTDGTKNVVRLEPEGLRGLFALPYQLNGNAGLVTLTLDQTYRANFSGPLQGQLNADPELQNFRSNLEAKLSSLKLDLPKDLKLGRLALEVSGTRSNLKGNFALLESQFQNLPLQLGGTGALELDSNFNLGKYSAQLEGNLKPFAALLPLELRPSTTLGTLTAALEGQGSQLSGTYALNGSEYARQPLALSGSLSSNVTLEGEVWKLRGDLLHPQIAAQLEARPTGLVLSALKADLSLLEPYLKGDLSGTLSGDLVLPNYDPLRAQGNLSGTVLRGADNLSGGINATKGNWSVNLLGTLLEKPIRVQGNVYPRASAQVRWDGLSGQLEGNLEQISARVQGKTFERSVDLRAQYAAGKVSASGVVDGVQIKADATLENGIKGSLEASAPDLRPLTGLPGNLELKVSFENLNARGTARGQIQGYRVNAPLEYVGGILSTGNATLEGLLSAGRPVTASVSGQVYPALNLNGNARISGDLPAQASFKVGGEFSAPTATATGALETSQLSLGTDWRVKTGRIPFTASLEKGKIALQLEGTGISGSASATLDGGFKLLEAQSQLKDVALEGQNTAVSATGTLGWTPEQGLNAKLQASGTVLGQAAALTVGGSSALELDGTLGQGRFKAMLGRDILDKPSGTAMLERIDVARFWGRPDALGLSAKLELGGSYAQPTGLLSGRLIDTKNVLSGSLEGQLSPQFARVVLKGAKLQGEARWSGAVQNGWSARLTALGADVSHLLPLEWNYGQVWLGGDLNFSAKLLEVKGLDLRVQNTELGKLRALGDLSWTNNEPVGKLRLEGLGGNATLEGKLSNGVALSVNALNLSRWNVGRVSGAATLRGALENPTLEGAFQVAGRYARGEIQVSGRVLDPQVSAQGELLEGAKGPFSAQLSGIKLNPPGARVNLKAQLSEPVQGSVSLEAQEFNLQKQTARVKLTTTLKSDGNALEANLNGIWPALKGTAQVSLPQLEAPLKIVGGGNGTYTLEAGKLGAGTLTLEQNGTLIPSVRANLTLEPLNLLSKELRQNLKGNATVGVTLEGDPLKPSVTLEGSSKALEYSGVKLDDLRVTGGGKLESWSDLSKLGVAFEQKGQTVGQANLNSVTLEGLRAGAFSSTLSLSGNYSAKGADFVLSSNGQFSGRVAGSLKGEVVNAEYSLGFGGYSAKGQVQTQLGGARALSGTAQLSGLPAQVVSGPADFTLSGTLDRPALRSSLNLLGAAAKLEAGLSSASLQFTDGPQTKAAGTLVWNAGKLGGEVTLERKLNVGELSDPLKATLGLSGTLENPQAKLSAQYRDVALNGDGSLERGSLQVRTRSENGSLSWKGQTVTSDVRDFNLSSLNLPGYSGVLGLVGSLDLSRQSGKVALKLENIKTPFTIPYLDLELAGSANGTLELGQNSKLGLRVQTSAGTLELNAEDRQGWRGQAKVDLKAPGGGKVQGVVALEGLEKPALSGSINAQQVQLNLADTPLSVDGKLLFTGQNFTLSGLLEAGGGKLRLEGDGAVADALPALKSVGLTQSDNGYQVRASLESVNLKNIRLRGLKLPDYLEGRVSGNAVFAESVSTFTLRSEALTLAGEELPARLEGTFSGGNLRLRGGFGDSSATGSVTDGLLSARLELVKTPLHAFIGAFSGPLPGKSYATGAARYRGRLDNLLGGQLEAVAENLSVEGGSQSLRGYGQLEYIRGVLKIPNIVLDGAGSVRVRGEYSPQKVDFTADFINTSFTPLLRLVPALRTLEPSLKGTVKVKIGGTFEQPSAQVTSQNLEGSFAGIAVKSTGLGGSLTGNLLELAGTLNASSVFTATGQMNARANLSVRGLSNTVINWNGSGKVDNFGPLEGIKTTLTQNTGAERWTVQASARQGGTISIGGEVAPRLLLNFVAQGINPVISPLFIKSSTLNARGKFERLTGADALSTQLSSPVSTDPPVNPENSANPEQTTLEGVEARSSVVKDRYRLSGGADFSSLLFGAVTAPTTPAGQQTPTTPGGSNFVSPLPDELTTFPQAKTAVRRAPSFLEQLEFDNFDLNASRGGVKIDENLARGEFTGRLTLSGTGSTPRLAGKLTPVRGSVFLRENEFLLENDTTQISFDPVEGFYPRILLNAKALKKVRLQNRDVTLKVQVTGDFITVKTVIPLGDGSVSEAREEKKLQLDTTLSTDTGISCSSSDVAAECGELYALLATGSGDLTNLTGNLTQSALKTAVNVFVIGELERGIARALNLSVFRIRTNALDFDPDLKADFTVGTYLTKEFYVQYQIDLQGNGLLDAQYTTEDGRFTFTVNTPLQWLDLSKAKPTFGLSYNLALDTRSSVEFGIKTGAANGNELKLLLNYRLSF